jgi:hypothetical protein
MGITLNPSECIDFIIQKKKYFPFKVEDLLKLLVIVMFSFFINLILNDIKRFNKDFSVTDLIPLLMMIIVFITLLINFYKRFLIAYKWKYIVTNQRLVIINHKDVIESSFYFNDFPSLNFQENAYGNGYLIIGDKEPVFAESKSFTSYRVGVNFSEEDFILYNIENVKNVYNIIKERIANYTIA